MNNFREKIIVLFKNKSLRFGLPFVLLIVGSSFGLEQFAQLRYRFSRQSTVSPDLLETYGVEMKKPGEVTLESEYEKLKDLDIDNWTNIRGPRPWEK